MSALDKFFQGKSGSGSVIGTYLYPYRLLSEPDWNDPYTATAVIATTNVDSLEVHITCNGGLFLRPPGKLVDFQDKIAFEEKASNAFNRIICEFAFHGIVSEPSTPTHISAGKMIDDHALITSAGGEREIYPERTTNPSLHLLLPQGIWQMYPLVDAKTVQEVVHLKASSEIAKVSESLPALTAGAYSLFSRRQLSEALIDSWIVIEQLVDCFWSTHISQVSDKRRRGRLKDTRTYTSSVRIEILHTIGTFPRSLYEALAVARKHRNDLAHRADINLKMARETVTAMKQMIEFYCGCTIEPLLTNDSLNW